MARTPSNMLPLGTTAPEFSLVDTRTGNILSLADIASTKATVIAFICNHCPFVKHLQKPFVKFANDYLERGIAFAAISSNDVSNYPDDSPEKMKELAEQLGFEFPYLYDETQEVAKAYDAACTPDFYIFNYQLELVYRGQFDNSRPDNDVPITGNDMRRALDAILSGGKVSEQQVPSLGCNIKWKP